MGWLEKQNETTQAWLKKQPVWHTCEMFIVFLCGCVGGVVLTAIVCTIW